MTVVFEIVLSYLIVRSLVNNLAIFCILRRFSAALIRNTQLEDEKHLVLILKVFQENELIESTVNYIAKEIEELNNISVIIVGTARERNHSGINLTLVLAENAASELKDFHIIEAPSDNGYHASQNNYALKTIKTPPDQTWILTLDIDSRFSRKGLIGMIENINDGKTVIQQSCLFLSNFRELGILQKGHAIYQSRWTIAHEIKRITFHNKTFVNVAHVVGHGLCIQLATLTKYGGFPEQVVAEDIALGFLLVADRKTITSLSVFEVGDCPNTLADGLRQEYVWSHGAMEYPLYLSLLIRDYPQIWNRNKFRCLAIVTQGVVSYIGWLTCSWIILMTIIGCVHGFVLALVYLFFYSCEFVQCSWYFYSLRLIPIKYFFLSPVIGLLGSLRRSIGADYGFILKLAGRSPYKYKTHHTKVSQQGDS